MGRPRTSIDKDGKFRIEGLAAGLNYSLHVSQKGYGLKVLSPDVNGLKFTIKAGENKDLGDIQVKPME